MFARKVMNLSVIAVIGERLLLIQTLQFKDKDVGNGNNNNTRYNNVVWNSQTKYTVGERAESLSNYDSSKQKHSVAVR